MKNPIKTITLSILVAAGILSSTVEAHTQAIAKLQSFAANAYGFICKYPISVVRDYKYPVNSSQAVAVNNQNQLSYASKDIIYDERFFEENSLKTLTSFMIHEHTHLDEEHAIDIVRAHLDFKNNKNVTIGSKLWKPEESQAAMLALFRNSEERADAGLKPFPDLCLNLHHFFKNLGEKQSNNLEQKLCTETDPEKRSHLATMLSILRSNNPELIKNSGIEDSQTHPIHWRRALYFKKWAQEGGLKNI